MNEEQIRQAFDLTIQGFAAREIRDKMELSKEEMHSIYMSKIFQSLLLTPYGARENKIQNNIEYIKGIEACLFRLLEERENAPSELKAKYGTAINEYQSIYSNYNIFRV
jgi:hypothetical protein